MDPRTHGGYDDALLVIAVFLVVALGIAWVAVRALWRVGRRLAHEGSSANTNDPGLESPIAARFDLEMWARMAARDAVTAGWDEARRCWEGPQMADVMSRVARLEGAI